MTPLGWVLLGSAVFVVIGAAAALKFGEWIDRKLRRRKAKEAEPEDAW